MSVADDQAAHLPSLLERAVLEWSEYMNAQDEFVLGQACTRILREPATFIISHLALNELTGGIARDRQSQGVTLDFAAAVWFPAYTFEIGPVVNGHHSSFKTCPLRGRTSISDASQDAWAMLATFRGQTEKVSTWIHSLPSSASASGPHAPYPIVYTESAGKIQRYKSVYANRLSVALQRPKRSPADQVAIQQRQAPAPTSRATSRSTSTASTTTTTSSCSTKSNKQTRKAETRQLTPLIVRPDHVDFTGVRTTWKHGSWVNTYRSKDDKWMHLTDDDTILGYHVLSTHWFETTTRSQGSSLIASLGQPTLVALDHQQDLCQQQQSPSPPPPPPPPPPPDLDRARLGNRHDGGSLPRASSISRSTSSDSARLTVNKGNRTRITGLGRNILETLSDESSDSELESGSPHLQQRND